MTETLIHADFASGALALAGATGAELALSSYDEEPYCYSMAYPSLRGRDVLRAGKLRIESLHTPGHTPEHLSQADRRPARTWLITFSGHSCRFRYSCLSCGAARATGEGALLIMLALSSGLFAACNSV